MANRVRELIDAGRPAIGAHAKVPTPAVVEIAAEAGLDFVRLDHYHWPYDDATLAAMTACAANRGVTPWVRCEGTADMVTRMLELGIRGFTLPCIASVAQARAVADAVDRFVGSSPGVARADILLGCAIENRAGLDSFEGIAAIEGVDIMSTGPSDLAFALGHSDNTHPEVRATYDRILMDAIARGKQVYLSTRATPGDWGRAAAWIARGARILIIEEEYRVLMKHLMCPDIWTTKRRAA